MLSGWITSLSGRTSTLARWAIVGGIAYTIISSLLYFIAGSTPATVDAQDASSSSASVEFAHRRANLKKIESRNLFGAPATHVSVVPVQEMPSATDLKLQLQGVFVSGKNPGDSVAIVAMTNRQGKLYAVGDRLPGNVELLDVQSDHILLENAGIQQILEFQSVTPHHSRNSSPGVVSAATVAQAAHDPARKNREFEPNQNHEDRWDPGFSQVLGMVVPADQADGEDGQ